MHRVPAADLEEMARTLSGLIRGLGGWQWRPHLRLRGPNAEPFSSCHIPMRSDILFAMQPGAFHGWNPDRSLRGDGRPRALP